VKASLLILSFLACTTMSRASQQILVGTSSGPNGPNQGIYTVTLDTVTGALSAATVAAAVGNPGFVVNHPRTGCVYSAGESGRGPDGNAIGAIFAYTRSADGSLTLLNSSPTGALAATHLVVDASGRMLIAASYHGSQVLAFPVAPDGRVGPRSTLITLNGRLGPNAKRQDKPHPHSVTLSPDNRHAYVCDLGRDLVYCYAIDPAAATLTPAGEFATPAGAGPRHSKFSADGRFLYVINELGSSVGVFSCTAATGVVELKQTLSTLPAGFTGENICAEIQVHPNGRFVYGSNRGHESLAVFARDERDGTLSLVEITPCGGRHPRHFALSPDGAWLVCAGRDTNNLVSFRVDPATGRLTRAGEVTGIPFPTCVLFAPAG
jgi:6-phosphogluconolactonase